MAPIAVICVGCYTFRSLDLLLSNWTPSKGPALLYLTALATALECSETSITSETEWIFVAPAIFTATTIGVALSAAGVFLDLHGINGM